MGSFADLFAFRILKVFEVDCWLVKDPGWWDLEPRFRAILSWWIKDTFVVR